MNPSPSKTIKVLVVEDSRTIAEFLARLLNADPHVCVVETVFDGEAVLEAVRRSVPDVITMDLHMPKVDGFEATRRVMENLPTPIVIVSGSSGADEVAATFRAVEAGALAVIPRPKGIGHPNHESTARELVQTVKLMAEVKVVRRWPKYRPVPESSKTLAVPHWRTPASICAVAIGASTGGPLVLQTILSGLPKGFPAPVLIVQHMAPGFVHGFAEWLGQTANFPVHVVKDGELLLPGHAYIAPDDFHLQVKTGHQAVLASGAPEHGSRPSVACLFRSVAETFGPTAIGILLTGMGKDGAEELQHLHLRGAITVAQDESSSVVHGMPGEAIRLGAATHVLSPEEIAVFLAAAAKNGIKKKEQP